MAALLCCRAPLAAQAPTFEVRAGAVAATTLVEDLLASTALRQFLGPQFGTAPRAWAAPSPLLEAGVRVGLRPGVTLAGLAGWQPTRLRIEDTGGTRDAQDLALLHGLLELTYAVRAPLFVAAGAGVLGYRSERTGLFSEGADVSPLVRLGAGAGFAISGHALTVRALGEAHRFGTAGIRTAGGESGSVFRYGVEAGLTWGGAR